MLNIIEQHRERSKKEEPEVVVGFENGEWFVMFNHSATKRHIIKELNNILKGELEDYKDDNFQVLEKMGVNFEQGFSEDTQVLIDIPKDLPLLDAIKPKIGEWYRVEYIEENDTLLLTPFENC